MSLNEQSPFGMPDLLVIDDEGYDTSRLLTRKESVTSPNFASCLLSRSFGQSGSKLQPGLEIEEDSKESEERQSTQKSSARNKKTKAT